MKNFFSLILFLVCINLHAQNWSLFPLNQVSHYRNTIDTTIIDSYTLDSVIANGTTTMGLFAQKDFNTAIAPCVNATVPPSGTFYLGNYLQMYDTLVTSGDSVFFKEFYFLPNSALNQSWNIVTQGTSSLDIITITCTSITTQTFLGITDSVKTFSLASNFSYPGQLPFSQFEIKLSKNYGLIEFIPFDLFLYHPSYTQIFTLQLIGINNNTAIGFSQPVFSDYFHLSAGDVLLWKRDYDSFSLFNPDFTEYFTDSIVQSLISADSVVYVINRTTLNRFGNIVINNGIVKRYLKTDYEELFATSCNSVANGEGEFALQAVSGWPKLLWVTSEFEIDTMFNALSRNYALGNYIDTSNCQIYEYIDRANFFVANIIAGISSFTLTNFDSDYNNLIGATINGVTYNRLPVLPVGVANYFSQSQILLSPNPANNFIKVSGAVNGFYKAEIADAMGRVIMQTEIINHTITLNKLDAGIYFLKLSGKNQEYAVVKFVKQ